MVLSEEDIRRKCLDELEASFVDCAIISAGCEGGAKVEITVVSIVFEGKSLLKRHRIINELFSGELASNEIHALTIKALTPTQFETKKLPF
jgi:stress-induced morphogen